MIAIAVISPVVGTAVGATLGLLGVLIGLWINGDRAERQRRRDLHGRALTAVIAYGEMPFRIRRRRCEDEHRSSERARLSDAFSLVQAELATCQVLLAADGDRVVSDAYDQLIGRARKTAGAEAHQAWKEPVIKADIQMNMADVFQRLKSFREELETFEVSLAHATLPRRKKLKRRALRRRHTRDR
jgi:hypothetical protein